MKKVTFSTILAIVFLLVTTITFAQNKALELNNGVLNELMQAGGFDTTQVSWSLETWLKIRTFDGTDESHFVEPWQGSAGYAAQFYFNPTTHGITCNGNAYSFGGTGETEILTGVWNHIAVSVDGDSKTFVIYLNGEEELSGATNENNLQTHPKMLDSLVIGHFRGLAYDADWGATQGKFDEVRVWYKALTQAEVKANMNKSITSGEGLVAVWNFDGSDVNTDATGNGHDLYSAGRVDATNITDDAPDLATAIEQETNTVPNKFSLSQNYPNPFNPTTVIDFAIAKESNVTLNVFNAIGQKVAELVNDNLSAGSYKASFDATNLSSGIYFYKISAGNFVSIKKMMLLK